jgi:hypothetical protein
VLSSHVQEAFDARPTVYMAALGETRGNRRLEADGAVVTPFFGYMHLTDQRPVDGFVSESEVDAIVLALIACHYETVVGAKKSVLVKMNDRPPASLGEGTPGVALALGSAEIE